MNNADLIQALKKGLPFRNPWWELYKATSGFYCVFDHNGSKKFINLNLTRHLDATILLKQNGINYFEYPDIYIQTVLFEKHNAKDSLKQKKSTESEERYWLTKALNE